MGYTFHIEVGVPGVYYFIKKVEVYLILSRPISVFSKSYLGALYALLLES